jgi:tetratricopeptide (TPR) repeat protein
VHLFVDSKVMHYGAKMTRIPAHGLDVVRATTTIHRNGRTFLPLILLLASLSGCDAPSDIENVRALQESGRYEQSLEPLRRGLERDPDDLELHYRNGLALAQTGRPTQAVWSLRKAMEDSEWLQRAGLLLASAGLRAHNHELALDAVDQVLAEHPEDADALVMRANIRIAMRSQFEGALEDAERALELEPELRGALLARLIALLGLERGEEAAEALGEIELTADDESIDPRMAAQLCAARSVFAKEKGDPDAAAESFSECLEEFPTDSLVVDNALEFYDKAGDGERSIEVLRQLLEEQPLALSYRSQLAGRLRAAGQVSEAEQLLLEATERHENAPEAAWVEVARHHAALEDYPAMAEAYERAVEVADDPTPDLRFVTADAFLLAQRLDDALAAGQALPLPVHRDLIVGRVHYERREMKEALERIEASLRLWPENAVARYYAALAAERLGDFDRAIEEYRYSIRSDAAATDARYRLAMLYEAEGRYALAVAAASSADRRVSTDPDATMIAIRAASSGGLQDRVKPLLTSLRGEDAMQARGLVALAEGTNRRLGPAAAAALLVDAKNLNLVHPGNAELLRALVIYRGSTGGDGRVSAALSAALKRHPDVADFHEIHGLRLEFSRAPVAETRTAFERALEIKPDHERALLGLARLEAANGRVEEALSLLARAIEASPESTAPLRAKAEVLIDAGRPEEAERALEELLHQNPYDGVAAATLASLQRDRGVVDARTSEFEARATRFGSGAGPLEGNGVDADEPQHD